MNNKKTNELQLIISTIFITFFCVATLGFVVMQLRSPHDQYIQSWCFEFDEGWSRVLPDGSVETIPSTSDITLKKGDTVEFFNTIPTGLKNGAVFNILSGRTFDVYIGGKLRYSYDPHKDNPIPRNTVKGAIHQIALTPEDEGAEIRIVKYDPKETNGGLSTCLIGDSYGAYKYYMQEFGFKMMIAITLVLLASLAAVVFKIVSITMDKTIHSDSLLPAIILVSLWVVLDNPLFQYWFGTTYVDGFFGYLLTQFLPFPFIIYMNKIQKRRYEKLYIIVEIMLLTSMTVFTALHVFTDFSFQDGLIILDTVVAIAILPLIYGVIRDRIEGNDKSYRELSYGFAFLGVCAIVDVAQLNLPNHKTGQFDGILLLTGLFFLLFCVVLLLIRQGSELRVEREEALRASKLKTNFLANMSHEIRTPINAVIGMNEMIIRESDQSEIKGYAANVKDSAEALLSIINDILDVTKIESGKLDIIPVEYELKDMVRQTCNLVKKRASDKGLKLVVDFDAKLPKTLLGDDVRIKQIITNMLTNAVKYTEVGTVTLKVSGEVSGDEVKLLVSVNDTGIGIKAEDLPKLKEAFTRLDEIKNRGVEGTGLGMSITIQLLEKMQSSLEVDSIYGKGSTFSFKLLQKIISSEPAGEIDLEKDEVNKSGDELVRWKAPAAKLLVVDDNRMNLLVFTKLLSRNQMKVDEAMSGKEAIALSLSTEYDLIFMDHMMPEMDGIEALSLIRGDDNNKSQHVPVIALTANAIAGARESYISAGFNDYLSKPFRPEELDAVLRKYLPSEKIEE